MDCGWPEFLSDVFSPHCFSVPFLNSQERKKVSSSHLVLHTLSQSNNMYLGQRHWTIQCGGQDCTNLRQFKNRILKSCPPQINGIKHAGRKTTIAKKVNISWGCTDLRWLWCSDTRKGSRRPLGKEVKDCQDVGGGLGSPEHRKEASMCGETGNHWASMVGKVWRSFIKQRHQVRMKVPSMLEHIGGRCREKVRKT